MVEPSQPALQFGVHASTGRQQARQLHSGVAGDPDGAATPRQRTEPVGGGGGVDIVNRETLWRGHTAGKGDDFRALGYFQDLTDGRCFHAGHAAC